MSPLFWLWRGGQVEPSMGKVLVMGDRHTGEGDGQSDCAQAVWGELRVCCWWLGCSCTKIQLLVCCGDHLISMVSAPPH